MMNQLSFVAVLGLLGACAPPDGPQRSLTELFERAESETGTPAELLAAISLVESDLRHDPTPSERGGRGLMHLISREDPDYLQEAAELLGEPPEKVARDLELNVRASAALLADYAGELSEDGDPTWSTWKMAAARYSGIPAPGRAEERAGEIFAVLREGAEVETEDGEQVVIEAHPDLAPLASWELAFTAASAHSELREDPVVGVKFYYPDSWSIAEDPYLFETHGFMLLGADLDPDDLHGPLPVARLGLDYDPEVEDVEEIAAAKMAEFPGLEMTRREIEIRGQPAIAVGPLPGAQVSTGVFLERGGHIYEIRYYGEELDARGMALLESLEFFQPARSVESLKLLRADSELALFGGERPDLEVRDRRAASHFAPPREKAPVPAAGEFRLANGCWAQPTWFFIQIAHSWDANGTGWSRMGTPNFWGQRTHGNWGMGRCYSGYYTNDLYAIDYYLRRGDRIYSPFRKGYVAYVGWDPGGWWNYGKMVVIRSPNGKYWSLSAHMSRVNVVPGQYVTDRTLIGWAGSTGYAAPYPHLHQVYYRWPYASYGRPYGGRGLKPTRLIFLGNGGGAYKRFWKHKWVSW